MRTQTKAQSKTRKVAVPKRTATRKLVNGKTADRTYTVKHGAGGRPLSIREQPTAAPKPTPQRTLTLARVEDTKNYAKFVVAEKDGVFGHLYVPLALADGLQAFVASAVKG